MRVFLYLCMIGSFVVLVNSAGLSAQGPSPESVAASVDTPARATNSPADFVGEKRCAMCHKAEARGLDDNPHAKLALLHDGQGVTCESCHGPGSAHVLSGGDTSKIFSFTNSTRADSDRMCLGCHHGDHEGFDRSAHAEAKIGCIECHSIHKPEEQAELLRLAQPALCYSCHKDVKPAFSRAFHHKVNEGLMQCTDCHDPHGTFQKSMAKTAAQDDFVCIKCHQENAGPFIYEHPVVRTEGCMFCHSPHGSTNPRLLVRNNLNQLCLQCHTGSENGARVSSGRQFNSGGPPTSPVHDQAMQYTSCIICHSEIHGSNVVDTFIR